MSQPEAMSRWFLHCCSTLFALSAMTEAKKANVVLFLVDDLGWMDLGCQGSSYYKTPNIDRLAKEGVRFTDAYSTCAVCTPTRASVLTGKYPARLMMTQWLPAGRWSRTGHKMIEGRFLRALPLEEITLAEALRESGYECWSVGKWHLGGAPFSLPAQHGFHRNIAGSDHGAPGGFFYPYKGTWRIPTTQERVLKQTLPDGEKGEYLTERLTDEVLGLIRGAKEKPFFLYFPYYAVHTPLQARKEMIAPYEKVPPEDRQGRPVYAAMVESVDRSVGRVMDQLKKQNLLENTIVIFTSDNGGFAKATKHAPLRANKGSHYEGGIRVPLICRGPGIVSGKVEAQSAISTDLYPTILSLLGLPARSHQHVDGESLAPLLQGDGQLKRKDLFWHYPHYNQHPESNPVSILRRGDWKLIEFLERDSVELYHLGQDIGERKNLAKKEIARAREMLTALREWKTRVRAEPMVKNPEYTGRK